ncbi:MAG: type IV pilin protein [Pseudomonas sp.]
MAHPESCHGTTLLELLAVLTLLGVLYALVMPQYRQVVIRSNRSEGQALLVDAAARQARHYAQTQQYITAQHALTALHWPVTENGEVHSATGLYRLLSEPGDGGYLLKAEPLGQQRTDSGCATLWLNGLGTRGSSGTASAMECWK